MAMDMTKPRAYVYHSDHDPKMVYLEDAQDYYDDGWKDSPAKCKGFLSKVGIEPDDSVGIQTMGEVSEKVKDYTNDTLNLHLKSAKELKAYAALHLHGMKYQKNWNAKRMLVAIAEHMKKPVEAPAPTEDGVDMEIVHG
jgi:hypothetical protein